MAGVIGAGALPRHLAIDIGASGGRHVLGRVAAGKIETEEVYRFSNAPVMREGHLCWDLDALWEHVLTGMAECARLGRAPATVGIDTWGVDFVLLDREGRLLGEAVCYRDKRTAGMDAVVSQIYSQQELYQRTGIQKQPFNTLYQLAALRQNSPGMLADADALLMMPDYLHFRLTGVRRQEYTNATTTGLVNARSKVWDDSILTSLGFPKKLFGLLSPPGAEVERLLPDVQRRVGFTCDVVLPASHDTASAFAAAPSPGEGGLILSSGTWSLLGVENPAPLTSEESRRANFTNEGGYEYRYRFLKNIMGLWMVQSLRRELAHDAPYAQLEGEARADAGFAGRVDVNDEAFFAPASMAEAVRDACRRGGQPVPASRGELLQCVYASLAEGYRRAADQLQGLTGQQYTHIHIVGGGSRDNYLNELTARSIDLPVYAGPTEATALGNLLVQMIARGAFSHLAAARAAVRDSFPILEVLP